MPRRFSGVWFCWKVEPMKMHGMMGLNGSAIPPGFEVGDVVKLCVWSENGSAKDAIEEVLTTKTFAGEAVALSDGRTIRAEDVSGVYRLTGI